MNNGDDSVSTGILPNNGIAIARGATRGNRISFQCRSGSTNSGVGDIIGLDEAALPFDLSGAGVTLNVRQLSPATVLVRNRVNNEDDLTADDNGVYTCRIPDESGAMVNVNIGVYANGFNSK